MSTTVDQRVVEMRFDNKQFENGVSQSLSTLDKLKKSLNLEKSAKGLEQLGKVSENVKLSGLDKAIETVHAKFSALEVVGITALANITNSAINAGKRIISALAIEPITEGFNEFELKMGSIQTIMAGTGEGLGVVNKYLEELNTYSDKTIYSFSDMTSNIGKFTNAGVGLKDAVQAIKGISNEAAVSGANAQQASHAMYNFAQALSAGYVKLIDWKSIENANMATVEFKNHLLETALSIGTVTKTADGMYETLKGNVFNATRNFNEVLTDQWMTTDVLVKTLGKYADETTTIGKKAFAAAQEVKTFSQLFGTLKEAAGSGWAQTWEHVIGNFEEAKELFTALSDVFGSLIDKSAKTRNALLEDWKLKGGRKALIDSFANVFMALARVITPIKEAFNEIFPATTGKRLADITKNIRDFTSTLGISKETAGNLKDTFKGLFSVLDLFSTIITTILKSLFPMVNTSRGILSIILTITGFIGRLISAGTKWIKNTGAIQKAIRGLGKVLFTFAAIIIYVIAKILEFVASVKDLAIVQQIGAQITNTLSLFGTKIAPYIDKARIGIANFIDKANELRSAGMAGVLSTIQTKLSELHDWFGRVKTSLANFIRSFQSGDTAIKRVKGLTERLGELKEKVTEVIQNSAIGKMFEDLGINTETLKENLTGVIDKLKEFTSTLTPGKVAAFLFSASLVAIAGSFAHLSSSLSGAASGVGGFFKTLTKIAKKQSASYNWILYTAEAFAILAASLAALTMVDQDKLKSSAFVMAAMMVTLLLVGAAMAAISRWIGVMDGAGKGLLAMAGSVLILTAALKLLETINLTNIWLKVGILGAIALEVSLAGLILSKMSGATIKGSIMLLAFALSIGKVVEALVSLENMEPDKLHSMLGDLLILMGGMAVLGVAAGKVGIGSFIGLLGVVLLLKQIVPLLDGIDLSTALKDSFASIDLSGIKAKVEENLGIIVTLGVLVGALVAVAGLFGKGLQKFGVGIAIMSASILILIECARQIGKLSENEFNKGTVAIGAALVLFALLEALSGLTSESKPIAFAVSLLAITGVIAILVQVAKAAGKIDPTQLKQGMIAVGVFMVLVGLLEGLSALTGKAKTGAITALILGLVIMFGEMVVLSQIPFSELGPAMGSMAAVMLAFGTAVALISKYKFDTKNIIAMIAMAGVVLEFAFVLMKMKDVPWQELWAPVAAMSACMLVFAKSIQMIGKTGQSFRKNKMISILEMVAPILAIGGALTLLARYDWRNVAAAGAAMGLALAELVVVMYVLGKIKVNAGDATEFLVVSLALLPIAGALSALAGYKWNELWPAMAAMSVCMVAIGGALAILGKAGGGISALQSLASGGAILITAASIYVLAGALKEFEGIKWDSIGQAGAALGGIAVVLGILAGIGAATGGIFAVTLIAAAAAFVIFGIAVKDVGVGLDLIAPALKTLCELPLTSLGVSLDTLGDDLLKFVSSSKGLAGVGFGLLAAGAGLSLLIPALQNIQNVDMTAVAAGVNEFILGLQNGGAILTETGQGLIIFGIGLGLVSGALLVAGSAAILLGSGLLIAGIGLIAAGAGLNIMTPALQILATLDLATLSGGLASLAISILGLGAAGIVLGIGSIGMGTGAIGLMAFAFSASTIQGIDLSTIAKGLGEIGVNGLILGAGGLLMGLGAPGTMAMGLALNLLAVGVTIAAMAFTTAVTAINSAFDTGIGKMATTAVKASSDCVLSLVNGFIKGTSAVNKAVSNLANNGIIKALRDTLGWHSPPKITEDLKDDSINSLKSIETKTGTVKSSWSKFCQGGILDVINEVTEKVKTWGAGLWKAITGAFSISGEGGLNGIEDFLGLGKDGPIQKTMEDAKKEAEEATKAASANTDLAESLEAVGGAAGGTQSDLESLTDTIAGQIDIFSEFNKKAEISGDQMIANMRSQISGVTEWANNMQTLAQRGISQGLLQELGQLGPQGYEKVAAFCQMTTEQLAEANVLYAQSMMLPQSASAQILGSYATAGKNASLGYANGIDPTAANANMLALATNSLNTLTGPDGIDSHSPSRKTTLMGKYVVEGFVNGIKANSHTAVNVSIIMATNVMNALESRLNANFGKDLGLNICKGLSEGIDSMAEGVKAKAKALGASVATATEKELEVESPSKRFFRIGRFTVMGLANGLVRYASIAVNASKNLAEDTYNGFSKASKKLSTVMDWDMDLNPIITPRLDLTDVQNGAGLINGMFSRQQASNISANFANSQVGKEIDRLSELSKKLDTMNAKYADKIANAINDSTVPVNVNVVLEGNAAGVFKMVKGENDKIIKSTGWNPLAKKG